ncbi:hypothetical protein YC2023_049757 [Brassica napus]
MFSLDPQPLLSVVVYKGDIRQKPTRKEKAPKYTFKDSFVILNHGCGKNYNSFKDSFVIELFLRANGTTPMKI